MTINQISIFVENKYGRLGEILSTLADENIHIIAATVADTSEYGILRLIVSEPEKAYSVLKQNNVSANLTDVLAISTESSAGNFAEVINIFTRSGLSIEYMYCFSLKEKSVIILRTHSLDVAREVIRRNDLGYISERDLQKL